MCVGMQYRKKMNLEKPFHFLFPGDPSVLVRLIHDGQLKLDKVEDHTEDELRAILDRCGASITPTSTKVCVFA